MVSHSVMFITLTLHNDLLLKVTGREVIQIVRL